MWLPEDQYVPPKGLKGKKLAAWYADRAKYRWTPIRKFKDGSIQFRCPQCDGRVTTNAKTRNPRPRKGVTNRTVPHVANIEDEYCCPGLVTIPVEQLDTYQLIPYGTLAWKQRYNRRMQIENVNNMVKDKGGLKDGWCGAFGLAPNNLGLLALAVAHNLREAKGYEYRKQSIADSGNQPPTPPSAPARNGPTRRGPPQ